MTLPVPDTGGTIGYFTDQALRQGGLTLQDVEIVPINTSIQAEALARGQTDIVLALEPWITRMLADPELGLLMPAEQFAPDMMASVIVYGEKPLTNPEIGKRFAVAYLKAVRQYANGKTERNIELLAAYTKLDPGLVEKTCWPASPVDGAFSMHSLIAYQAWLRERGLLDRTLSPDEFLDTQFVEAANERLAKEAK